MSDDRAEFCAELRRIVGRPRVLTRPDATLPYRRGYRFGEGAAVAVVRPRSLLEMWRILKICLSAGKIVIMQAANTGLTGGSTPSGDYDRDVVLISTLHMKKVFLIDAGRQVICLPGATLNQLERLLAPLGREPHSVIGSSCIGASVLGGICNNSGGSLVRRGPAFTQMALYARAEQSGQLRLINHLGVNLGAEPEEILGRLEGGAFQDEDVENVSDRQCADHEYIHRVRDIDSDLPARFNADPGRLFEAAGSAGRLALFAVRLNTFPKDKKTKVFYIGTNEPNDLSEIRRRILKTFRNLPISGEYIHRAAFDLAERYGKDTFLAIQWLGTSRLPLLFQLKSKLDALVERLGVAPYFSDRVLQWLSHRVADHLPSRMRAFRDRFSHHLLLKVADEGIEEAETLLREFFPSTGGDYFECGAGEGAKAFMHRFAVAGAAVRYRNIHVDDVADIVSLDFALPRNAQTWTEQLPSDLATPVLHALYYGHFFCHVFHHDYIVAKGHDVDNFEHRMMHEMESRHAEFPAEHNVGHLYKAKPALAAFYRELDPGNHFNPGIGQTSKRRDWEN